MRSYRGKLAPALIAVAYGALAALGQALHLLPGLDHFSSAHGHCCLCEHGSGDSPAPAWTHGDDPTGSSEPCPVCDLLALSQDRAGGPPSLVADTRLRLVTELGYLSPSREPVARLSARGPPRA